jgi:hypothetical protein
MKRDLCVVASRPRSLTPDELAGDFLALSLPAMAALRNLNIHFLTPEDIYPRALFEQDAKEFSEAALKWLTACDKVCEAKLGVRRAFSDNGFWFIHRLSDIHYLHCLAGQIIRTGLAVRLVVPRQVQPLPQVHCDFGALRLADCGHGLDHALTFLAAAIPACIIRSDERSGVWGSPVSNEPLTSLIGRASEILTRRLTSWHLRRRKKVFAHRFWVVQGGYDVDVLEVAMPEVEFRSVASKLAADAMREPAADVSALEADVSELADAFSRRWLPAYSTWLRGWIVDYLRDVVGRLPAVAQRQEKLMAAEAPSAVLYSIGAQTVLEGMVARIANQKGIPVFYFKHGGPETLFVKPSILDQFFEQDPTIERVQFLHSQVEQESFKGMTRVSTCVVGPLAREVIPDRKHARAPLRALYSVGPPAHYTFKDMARVPTDAERFYFASALVEGAATIGVPLDVKVHPAEWKVGWDFFEELMREVPSQKRNTRLIAGGSIERIVKNYGLLIVDMIATRVLSEGFFLEIPMIIYVPTNFEVRLSTIEDLGKRAYIARSDKELHGLLSMFRNGKLPALRSLDFDERYLQTNQKEAINAAKAQIWKP